MIQEVPLLSIIFMVISLILVIVIPVYLFVYFVRKKADKFPFFVGVMVMLIFVFIFEAFVHNAVLSSTLGIIIKNNYLLYALWGGLMAALFEETGRIVAFKTVLQKYLKNDQNALMYGAGHGCFEAIVVLGFAMISNLIYAFFINSGNINTLTASVGEDNMMAVTKAIQFLIDGPSYFFILGIFERIFTISIHISLSVIVWFAVKRNNVLYYLLAYFLHFFVDTVVVLISNFPINAFLLEGIIGIFAIVIALISKKIWVKETNSNVMEY